MNDAPLNTTPFGTGSESSVPPSGAPQPHAPYQQSYQEPPAAETPSGSTAPYQPYYQQPQTPPNGYASSSFTASSGFSPSSQTPPPPQQTPNWGQPSNPQPSPKRWPWILLGLALGFVLGLGSCAGCAGSFLIAHDGFFDGSSSSARNHSTNPYSPSNPYHSYPYPYCELEELPDTDSDNSINSDDYLYRYSSEEIDNVLEIGGPDIQNGQCFTGVYTVGDNEAIAPGLYYAEGTHTAPSHIYVFEAVGPDSYELQTSLSYFGNYFVEAEEGELLAFVPADENNAFFVASPDPTSTEPPYRNGCYRVGIDIPAGTYLVTADDDAYSAVEPGFEPGAFVMKDLDFDEDSIVEEKYIIRGSRQTITVEEGQYFELFGAQASPAE